MDSNADPKNRQSSSQDASANVAEAHGLLKRMREQMSGQPDLDLAIEKLEMALSLLTTNTGGML